MIWPLRIFFSGVLVTMLLATSWASYHCALWKTPEALVTHIRGSSPPCLIAISAS